MLVAVREVARSLARASDWSVRARGCCFLSRVGGAPSSRQRVRDARRTDQAREPTASAAVPSATLHALHYCRHRPTASRAPADTTRGAGNHHRTPLERSIVAPRRTLLPSAAATMLQLVGRRTIGADSAKHVARRWYSSHAAGVRSSLAHGRPRTAVVRPVTPAALRWATRGSTTAAHASAPPAAASSSSFSSSPAPAGGWYGHLADACVIRVAAAKDSAPATELLKYLHNLVTQDVYGSVAERDACDYTMFLNSKGRVMFDGLLAPIDDASLAWMRQAVQYAPAVTKGPAGVAREGSEAGPAPKPPVPEVSSTPRGFYLTVTSAVLPTALAHLSQFNLRRKITITDVTNHVDVFQVIPFQVLHDASAPTASADAPRLAELKQLFGVDTDEQLAAASALSATVDPRCRTMGVRVITQKGHART